MGIIAVMWMGGVPRKVIAAVLAVCVVGGLIAIFGTGYRAGMTQAMFKNAWKTSITVQPPATMVPISSSDAGRRYPVHLLRGLRLRPGAPGLAAQGRGEDRCFHGQGPVEAGRSQPGHS